MTREDLDNAARLYIAALNQYRQENPDENTGVLYVAVLSGAVGRYSISANMLDPNPYEVGTPEHASFYVPRAGVPVSSTESSGDF